MIKRLCPIYAAAGQEKECLTDFCVWWLEDQQACAMVATAKNTLATAIAVNKARADVGMVLRQGHDGAVLGVKFG
jgi:hypothetical protein